MANKGDTRRPRTVKAVFDENFSATSHGGAVVIERVLRRLGIRRILSDHLPPRQGDYSSAQVCEQVIEGLLTGGKGFQAAESLRKDAQLKQIFGHENVAEEATVFRAMCDLGGIAQRKFSEAYEPAAAQMVALDVFGEEKPLPCHRRIVCETPERIDDESREKLAHTLHTVALRCARALRVADLSLMGFTPVHGDGTDLEVRGRCFEGARKNHNGDVSLRLLSVSLGPLFVAQGVYPGATDEGLNIPALIREAGSTICELAGRRPVLALMDAAYAEKQVVDELLERKWFYLICANQYRVALEQMADEVQESQWTRLGPDQSRGWSENQVSVLRHTPEGWSQPQKVVVRRWREVGELPTSPWHYSFLYTNLETTDLPRGKRDKYGYASLLWMLYSTKQAHENNYKPLLSDLGLHHPPSGRLAATQAFAFVCALASNIHAVVSNRVVPEEDRGIRPWRFIRDYVLIPARVSIAAGRTLLVRLAGADVGDEVRRRWLSAFSCAMRL